MSETLEWFGIGGEVTDRDLYGMGTMAVLIVATFGGLLWLLDMPHRRAQRKAQPFWPFDAAALATVGPTGAPEPRRNRRRWLSAESIEPTPPLLPVTGPMPPEPEPEPDLDRMSGNVMHPAGWDVFERNIAMGNGQIMNESRSVDPTVETVTIPRHLFIDLLLSSGYRHVGVGDGTWAYTGERDARR